MAKFSLKIGTRGSPLALKQVDLVESALSAAQPDIKVERVIIKTSGDWKPEDGEKPLSAVEGGKGLFVKEIEKALLDGTIDCAVHSTKDVPSFLSTEFGFDHFLMREDPRDAFICRNYKSFMDLPVGAKVGTTSPRRQAFILSKRPDLQTVTLRGNVQTRLDKLDAGQVDAAVLAFAGLKRLNISGDFIHPMAIEQMIPACGQGAIGIETRSDDFETRKILDGIHHMQTGCCVEAERAALQVLDGSCHTPIGCYATLEEGVMRFNLHVASLDGQRVFEESGKQTVVTVQEARAFGAEIAARLKSRVPPDLLS